MEIKIGERVNLWCRAFKTNQYVGFRLKVQLSDSAQGTRSPIRQPKRNGSSNVGFGHCFPCGFEILQRMGHFVKLIFLLQSECAAHASSRSDELDCQCSSAAPEISNCSMGSSEKWMVLSISGDKPTPRFNVNYYFILFSNFVSCGILIFIEVRFLLGGSQCFSFVSEIACSRCNWEQDDRGGW